MGDPVGAVLLLGSALCVIAASLMVCYLIWVHTWEGWEAWSARTGLDADRAAEERLVKRLDRE